MTQKQKNEKEKQATRVLYAAVAAMLVVMAVIVMLTSVLSNIAEKPATGTQQDTGDVTGAPVPDDKDTAPSTDAFSPDRGEESRPVIGDDDRDEPAPPPSAEAPTLSSPVEGILSYSYSDSVLVYSVTMEDYRTHMGIDINAALGAPVYAAADGIILDVWYDPMMGSCVKVEHAGGLECIYRNLAEDLCPGIGVGSSLLRGDAIGYVGESAMIELAQEPHLHFEAKIDGAHVDPMSIMSAQARASLTEDTSYEG